MVAGIIVRSILLLGLSWLLTQKGNYIIPESWFGKGFDLASLVMIAGGLFLDLQNRERKFIKNWKASDGTLGWQCQTACHLAKPLFKLSSLIWYLVSTALSLPAERQNISKL